MAISSSPSRSMGSIVLTIPRWASCMLDGIAAWPNGSATTVAGARPERHDSARRGRGGPSRPDRDEWPAAVDDRRDQAVDEGDGAGDERRPHARVEPLQDGADGGAEHESERNLRRSQAEQPEEAAADGGDHDRVAAPEEQPEQGAEDPHQEDAAEDPLHQRLRLRGGPVERRQDLRRRVHHGADHRAERGPDAVDRRAERRTARSPGGGTP